MFVRATRWRTALLFLLGLFLTAGPWSEGVFSQGKAKKARPGDAVLSPEKQLAQFKLPPGFTIELVAAEPAVINPVTMALDEKGRLYVSESHTYRYGPKGSPVGKPTNPIIRLDPVSDGKTWKRTLVADGFDDPVMGMLVHDGKMWCTSNDHLYLYNLGESGKASNRRELVRDRVKAWNPFGMFVLEWGPEGMLYMSVGNHGGMKLVGPDKKEVGGRGGSGVVLRMKPDGSAMEPLVQGLRVPYSFEYDPFGQLWLLSNGQGNPDRYLKVIEGVDYHCYSRKVDNVWLAGRNPLAPPCFETPNGARTQLLHYYGANFPVSYQGRQFGVNWGPHGVGTRNHALEEWTVDDRERVVKAGQFLTSSDPRFRPTQLLLDHDGSLLVADWYGRDDESDLTGRIWRIRYTGGDRPKAAKLAEADWTNEALVLAALGSLDHRQRERAVQTLAGQGQKAVKALEAHAAKAEQALGAANALWTLVRIGTGDARAALAAGSKHPDWRIRRLALRLLRRYDVPGRDLVAASRSKDADPAVRLEAALGRTKTVDRETALLAALSGETASDPHLRYEGAAALARVAGPKTFQALLSGPTADQRLAGLIALDVAIYENTPAKETAQKILLATLASPGSVDLPLLLNLAALHPAAEMVKPLRALLDRRDVPMAVVLEGARLLKKLGGGAAGLKALGPWLEGVRAGKVRPSRPEELVLLLDLLAAGGPSPFALKQIERLAGDRQPMVSQAAHTAARQFGTKASALAPVLWKRLRAADAKSPERIDLVSTLASIEEKPDREKWKELLKRPDVTLVREVVRDLRRLPKDADLMQALAAESKALLKSDRGLKDDLALTLETLGADASIRKPLGLDASRPGKEAVSKYALTNWNRRGGDRVTLGRQAFVRASCAKCHGTLGQETLGPSLAAIGKREPAYVVESILEPSKVILTGYEMEEIELTTGVLLSGLVQDAGKELIVRTLEKTVTVVKSKIANRTTRKKSLMPDGLEKQMSAEELTDLVAYLMSLKGEALTPVKKRK